MGMSWYQVHLQHTLVVVTSSTSHHCWCWTRTASLARAENFAALYQIVDDSVNFCKVRVRDVVFLV